MSSVRLDNLAVPHTQWYYLDEDHQQVGPVASPILRERVAKGLLRPTDFIWRAGLKEWVEARKVRGLFGPAPTPTKHAPAAGRHRPGADPKPAKKTPAAPEPAADEVDALPLADELEEVKDDGLSIFAPPPEKEEP